MSRPVPESRRAKKTKARNTSAKVSPTSLVTPIANIDEQLSNVQKGTSGTNVFISRSIKMPELCSKPATTDIKQAAAARACAGKQTKTTEIMSMEEYFSDIDTAKPAHDCRSSTSNIFAGVAKQQPSSLLKVRQQGTGLNLSRATCYLNNIAKSTTMASTANKMHSMNITAIYDNYMRANKSSLKAIEKSQKATMLCTALANTPKKTNYTYVQLLQGPFILGTATKRPTEAKCI